MMKARQLSQALRIAQEANDGPSDPSRREAIKKGGAVAIAGILAAGGMTFGSGAASGLSQSITDSLYVKLNPLAAENIINSPSDSVSGLDVKQFSEFQPVSGGVPIGALRVESPNGRGWRITGGNGTTISARINDTDGFAIFMAVDYVNRIGLAPAGNILLFFPDTNFPQPNSHGGDIQLGDDPWGLILHWQTFNTEPGKGGVTLAPSGLFLADPVIVGLPSSDVGGVNFKELGYGDHRHGFSGRFFFSAFLQDLALGAVLPVIWQRSIIANKITLNRITVDSLTPSTGVGNDTIRCGDGTTFLSVNLGAGATTATAAGSVNLNGGVLLRIDVSARNTIPAKAVNVAVDYTMNQ